MKLKKYLPLISLLMLLAIFFATGGYKWVSLEQLKLNQEALLRWIKEHYLSAQLVYCAVYAILVAISFPGATLLTLLGGYFFGFVEGTLLAVCSATLGAVMIFGAVKFALGESLAKRAAGWVAKMQKGFEEDAFSYLMVLRLVPLFPFWVVNIVPALLNVSFKVFFVTTFLGIIPGAAVYVSVGQGLGQILEHSDNLNSHILLEPKILLPILGLCLLSLIPMVYKRIRKSKEQMNEKI